MTLRWRKKALLAKTETTYGVDALPVGGTDAIQVLDLTINPLEGGTVQRDIVRPYFGARPSLAVETHAAVEFGLELAGSGTAGVAPPIGPVLRACGMAETIIAGDDTIGALVATGTPTGAWSIVAGDAYTGTIDRTVTIECTTPGASGVAEVTVSAPAVGSTPAYEVTGVVITSAAPITLPGGATVVPTVTADFGAGDTWTIAVQAPRVEYRPVSDGFESVSIGYYLDGTRHRLLGARGTFSLDLSAQKFPTLKCQFKGLFASPETEALPTADYTAFVAPVVACSANTTGFAIHGLAAILESLSVDMANSVEGRFLIGAEAIDITDRQPKGSVKIEAPALAMKNFFAVAKAGTTGAMTITHGTAVGNIVEIACPAIEAQQPKYSDSKGITMLEMSITPLPVDGDDEIVLTFR